MTQSTIYQKRICNFYAKDNSFCLFPWKGLSLRCDGKVVCGCSGLNKHIIGDIKDSTIKSIWNNNLIHKIRKHQKGLIKKPPHGFCGECEVSPIYKSDIPASFTAEKLQVQSSLPIEYLMVETTAHCNLNCPGCFCNDGFALSERNRKNLTFKDFKKVIDELKTELKSIHFFIFMENHSQIRVFLK